jgi:hypothetical protein
MTEDSPAADREAISLIKRETYQHVAPIVWVCARSRPSNEVSLRNWDLKIFLPVAFVFE